MPTLALLWPNWATLGPRQVLQGMNLVVLRQKPGCEGKPPFSAGTCLCHGTVILTLKCKNDGRERGVGVPTSI